MSNLGSNFYPKLVQMTSELGMKPEDLLVIMVSESGLDSSAHEKNHGASGLVQFMPFVLPAVGWKGTPEEFREISGEEQLDYIKNLIKINMNLNGGPFTSAAQYYVANFWPVALKLPGIRNNDPETVFIEEDPETVEENGQTYSKKYFDVGIKIPPSMESNAYKVNKLFHGSTPGAITFEDMIKQVDKIKQNPIYLKALSDMKKSTSEIKPEELNEESGNQKDGPESSNDGLDNVLDTYLKEVSSSNKKLYRKLLTNNIITIQVKGTNDINSIEFSRILCATLDEVLLSKSFTHKSCNNVEVECNINGPRDICISSVKEISSLVKESFMNDLIKINFLVDKKSSYKEISLKEADMNYRKFILKRL